MCCRDVPCLAHMEQGPDPLHPEHLPPSLSAWVLGTQSTSSSQQGKAAQPRTCGPRKVYVNIVLYFPSSNTVFWNAYLNDYQMIICIVLIVVIFLGLINHIME
jgi:hypothetical protein